MFLNEDYIKKENVFMKTLAKIFVVIWAIIGVFLTFSVGLAIHVTKHDPNAHELYDETFKLVSSIF